MKYVKNLGLAAMATIALMAFGAGTASAAELYSTGVTVNAGTTLEASLESGTSAVLTTTDGSTIIDTCTGSTVKGTVNAYTGGDVTGGIGTLGWSGCTFTTDTLTNGALSINASGTVSGSGSVVTVNTGVTCRYGTGTGTVLSTLNTGKLAINAVINEQEPKHFLCPDTTKWVATYVVTSPHDLTVSAEEVKLKLIALNFNEGESTKIEAENTGNVNWTVKEEKLLEDQGKWEPGKEACLPLVVAPEARCKRELKCVTKETGGKTGLITWTLVVESGAKAKAEETLKINC